MEELSHTFGLLDARELDHDTSHAALQLLDVGLYDAEAVDTCTEDVVGVCHCRLDFTAEHAFHFGVAALCADLVSQLLGGEYLGEAFARGELVVFVDKEGDEVALAADLCLGSVCHCLVEGFIRLVVRQCFHYFGDGHLEDDVHTTLQVQTQSDFHLTTLF